MTEEAASLSPNTKNAGARPESRMTVSGNRQDSSLGKK